MQKSVVRLTRRLVDIPSLTGEEVEVGRFLLDYLRRHGWECQRQAVESDRFNILALRGRPEVLLSTHMDTVPPFISSSEDDEFIYGRGSCDAKGQAAAMITAAEELVSEGIDDLGLLFVVGEETDSAGAKAAAGLDLRCRFLINGEPTDRHLVSGHKGTLSLRFTARGTAAHSGYPEEGESAIEKMLDLLQEIRSTTFPVDETLGETHVNVGVIEGGQASNVIADQARAELMIRGVTDTRTYLQILKTLVADRVRMEIVSTAEPQRLAVVDGFPVKTVAYGTDIHALRKLGTPLLFGPGSILVAHTQEERISKRELEKGVEDLKTLVYALKGESKSKPTNGRRDGGTERQ